MPAFTFVFEHEKFDTPTAVAGPAPPSGALPGPDATATASNYRSTFRWASSTYAANGPGSICATRVFSYGQTQTGCHLRERMLRAANPAAHQTRHPPAFTRESAETKALNVEDNGDRIGFGHRRTSSDEGLAVMAVASQIGKTAPLLLWWTADTLPM
ncbi:hypothetical protein B0H17DRAFT_1137488 [Mycena rosella]|uniref:Uncharacterized protein n=1 Tax=Mycena rosella TaxID=1033263 RepID=A0AAD7D8L3_MYCRO|nr:hypothetical protein B0H17DRAFT_1137488 [Mycena rosella]